MSSRLKIEFIAPDEGQHGGALVGGGVVRKARGRAIYRVMLRAGEAPQCTINGEPYLDEKGSFDRVMWELLVAVRSKFNA